MSSLLTSALLLIPLAYGTLPNEWGPLSKGFQPVVVRNHTHGHGNRTENGRFPFRNQNSTLPGGIPRQNQTFPGFPMIPANGSQPIFPGSGLQNETNDRRTGRNQGESGNIWRNGNNQGQNGQENGGETWGIGNNQESAGNNGQGPKILIQRRVKRQAGGFSEFATTTPEVPIVGKNGLPLQIEAGNSPQPIFPPILAPGPIINPPIQQEPFGQPLGSPQPIGFPSGQAPFPSGPIVQPPSQPEPFGQTFSSPQPISFPPAPSQGPLMPPLQFQEGPISQPFFQNPEGITPKHFDEGFPTLATGEPTGPFTLPPGVTPRPFPHIINPNQFVGENNIPLQIN